MALWGDGWQGPSHTAASVTRQRLSLLTGGPGVDLWALSRWGSQRALTGISIETPPEASLVEKQPDVVWFSKEAVDVRASGRRAGQSKRYREPGARMRR